MELGSTEEGCYKSQADCKQYTWHLGANVYQFFQSLQYKQDPDHLHEDNRPLGATHCSSSLYDQIYKKFQLIIYIMTRPLGATLGIFFLSMK